MGYHAILYVPPPGPDFEIVLEKIRVLIVDDVVVVVVGLRSILNAHDDVEVVGEAATVQELNDMLKEMTPDLVLLDDETLGPDTPDAVGRIKRDLPALKVLLMSVHDVYVGPALDAGADAVIMKDASRQDLLRMIRGLAGV